MSSKFLSYIILPNYIYENKYKKMSIQVFNDRSLEWNQVCHFSEHWYQFPEYLCYSYPAMKKVIKFLTEQMLQEDCTYHREKFHVFSNLFVQSKMGETVFLRYLTLKDMEIIVGPHNLESAKM
jgi:hypothetical protein